MKILQVVTEVYHRGRKVNGMDGVQPKLYLSKPTLLAPVGHRWVGYAFGHTVYGWTELITDLP